MAERRLRRKAAAAAGSVLLFLLNSCAPTPSPTPHLELSRVSFADLPGWHDGDQAAALVALLRSCGVRQAAR